MSSSDGKPSESSSKVVREAPEERPKGPTHAADGTDLTLIRWMLSLSHAERLQVLQSGARSLALLRDVRPGR
jgi:hypothetical protein